ncbi:hypothetical protein GCM10023088_49760 [Actinomadura verrucosospora]|uniref:hypothetical protein n=1 Tax=Actinomadura verrucosospora TaxID=46165 RepID=UPI0031EDCDBA
MALSWLLHRSDVILPIPGTSNVAHLPHGISTQARDGVPAETMQRSADALLALWGKTVVAENRGT